MYDGPGAMPVGGRVGGSRCDDSLPARHRWPGQGKSRDGLTVAGGRRNEGKYWCLDGMHYLPFSMYITFALDQVGALASIGWRCWTGLGAAR